MRMRIYARMSPIVHIRKNVLRMKQAEFGALAGVGQGVVSRWERGELEPDRDKLEAIRNEIIRRELKWDDAWFFDAPAQAAE